MIIDEAIEIKRHSLKWGRDSTAGKYPYLQIRQADQLGMEALERERDCRGNAPREEWLLLPSETEQVQ